jgi:hypothetical protein
VNKLLPILFSLLATTTVEAQNIGIGSSTATRAKLEVVGVAGAGNTSAIFGSEGAGISLQTNWPTIGFNQYRDNPAGTGKYMASGYAASQYFDPASGTMVIDMLNAGALNTNTPVGYRAMTLTPIGIGIRTGSVSASLTVARGDGVDGTAVFAGATHWTHFNYSTDEHTYIRSGTNNGAVYVNNLVPNGNILIGSGATKVMFGYGYGSAPPATVYLVTGQFGDDFGLTNEYNHVWSQHGVWYANPDQVVLFFKYNGAQKGHWLQNGGFYVPMSDARLKKDIVGLEPVLQKLKNLNPVSYTMINDNPEQKRSIGFIAQEVKPLFPNLVRVVNNHARKGVQHDDLHTMNYMSMNVVAIKALQEQYQQIQLLEQELESLSQVLQQLDRESSSKK